MLLGCGSSRLSCQLEHNQVVYVLGWPFLLNFQSIYCYQRWWVGITWDMQRMVGWNNRPFETFNKMRACKKMESSCDIVWWGHAMTLWDFNWFCWPICFLVCLSTSPSTLKKQETESIIEILKKKKKKVWKLIKSNKFRPTGAL